MGSSSLAGLSTLFRRNPHRDRMQTTAGMIDRSGLAKPFLMGELGRQTRAAEDYEEQSASTLSGLYRDEMSRGNEQAAMKEADDVMKMVADLAKQDPIAATQYYNARAEKNKYLPPGLVFRRSLDGKSLMEIKDKKGQVRGVINATDMFRESDELEQRGGQPLGEQERAALAEKYFYPVPDYEKPDDEEGTHKKGDIRTIGKTVNGKPVKVTEEYQGKEKGWVERGDVPAFAPKEGGEGTGRVKATDSRAIKIEAARKYLPLAIRQLEAKSDLPPQTKAALRNLKALRDAMSTRGPLSEGMDENAVYAALADVGQQYADEFDAVAGRAESTFTEARGVIAAVNDGISWYHKQKRGTKGGGKDQPGPASDTPEATKTIGGKTYIKVQGKWYEQ